MQQSDYWPFIVGSYATAGVILISLLIFSVLKLQMKKKQHTRNGNE